MSPINLLTVALAVEIGALVGLLSVSFHYMKKLRSATTAREPKPVKVFKKSSLLEGASLRRVNLSIQRSFTAWLDGER
jgi:hypothetical protein